MPNLEPMGLDGARRRMNHRVEFHEEGIISEQDFETKKKRLPGL